MVSEEGAKYGYVKALRTLPHHRPVQLPVPCETKKEVPIMVPMRHVIDLTQQDVSVCSRYSVTLALTGGICPRKTTLSPRFRSSSRRNPLLP